MDMSYALWFRLTLLFARARQSLLRLCQEVDRFNYAIDSSELIEADFRINPSDTGNPNIFHSLHIVVFVRLDCQ